MNQEEYNIPTYSSITDKWTTTVFKSRYEFTQYLWSQLKTPGNYGLKNTYLWRQPAVNYSTLGRYCQYEDKSKEARNWYSFEMEKFQTGLIIDSVYLDGYFYFYLNFTPIYDKVKGRIDFPRVWDSDYHYFLVMAIARGEGKNVVTIKPRQYGYSLKHVSMLIKDLYFNKDANLKIVGYDDQYISGEWSILTYMRNWLNEKTLFYRNFDPDSQYFWVQRRAVSEGILDKKKTYKGRNNTIKAVTAKHNPTKAAGGSAKIIYCTEGGIFPNLDKFYAFASPNISLGNIVTGTIYIAGAAGELKDCGPLRNFVFNPEENGFLGLPDEDNPSEKTGFFCKVIWNKSYQDPITKEIIDCYDEDGNSDLEKALYYYKLEEAQAKKKSPQDYKLWKSQYPLTLKDAFDLREDNIFPTELVSEQIARLDTFNPLKVKIKKDQEGKLKHFFCPECQIVTDWPIKASSHRDGSIVILEPPVEGAPPNLYYAGVDPIKQIRTQTSESLMSCYIFKAAHQLDGEYFNEVPVAWFTGRHQDPTETYKTVETLIHYYNAKALIENDQREFISWMIQRGNGQYMFRQREIVSINDTIGNTKIFTDDYGITTGQGKIKELLYWPTVIKYLEEVIRVEYDKEGMAYERFGVERIKDVMLLKEIAGWAPKRNTDRLMAFVFALLAVQSNKLLLNIPKTNQPIITQSFTHKFGSSPIRGTSGILRKRWK